MDMEFQCPTPSPVRSDNPILWADYPDLDPIHVGDTYYMVSTTMHMTPGCVILRSYDLAHWETACHVFDTMEDTPGQCLEGERHIYSAGMWAASLRYHDGRFHVCFVCNDTRKTWIYTAADIDGPWEKSEIDGFYHDCSLLFDDDGRVYIVYGNTEIRLTELRPDLSGPLPGGRDRVIVHETEPYTLGYEGAHFYKIDGRYYVFFIHAPGKGRFYRTNACFMSESLDGEFAGREIFDDDMGFYGNGVAQGGIVQTPDGDWFMTLFQDHGAVGRIPVLVPMHWDGVWPVGGIDGKAPVRLELPSARPGHRYAPLVGSDDFSYAMDGRGKIRLKDYWQWNHTPDPALWYVTERPGAYRIRTGKLAPNVHFARNTLTQRTFGPMSTATVTVDASGLNDGDVAGLGALIGTYGLVAVTRENGGYFVVMLANDAPPGARGSLITADLAGERGRFPLPGPVVTLRITCRFAGSPDPGSDVGDAAGLKGLPDYADFFYADRGGWKPVGVRHHLEYHLDYFMGCRFGLFLYSAETAGGHADFTDFTYDGP